MNKREYLMQAIKLNELINSKLDTIAELRALAVKSTGVISATPSHPGKKSRLEEIVCKIADLENEVNSDIDRLIEKKREISETISNLDDFAGQLVLEKHYLQGKNYYQIAVELDRSESWVYRVHKRAIDNLEIPDE